MTTPNDPMTQLVNDLFDELVFEGGYTVTTCRSCGRLLVSKSRGMKREYCDETCRSWHHKNKEKAPFSHIRRVEHKPENKAQELLDRMCEIEMQPVLTTEEARTIREASDRIDELGREALWVCHRLEEALLEDIGKGTTLAAESMEIWTDTAHRNLDAISEQIYQEIAKWREAMGGK